jgi:hypothetical protein
MVCLVTILAIVSILILTNFCLINRHLPKRRRRGSRSSYYSYFMVSEMSKQDGGAIC